MDSTKGWTCTYSMGALYTIQMGIDREIYSRRAFDLRALPSCELMPEESGLILRFAQAPEQLYELAGFGQWLDQER